MGRSEADEIRALVLVKKLFFRQLFSLLNLREV